MISRTLFGLTAAALILFTGCRSKEPLELYRPGDVPVWRTATTTPTAAVDREQRTMVAIETSMGPIVVELYDRVAPESVRNFLRYVDEGFFDGLIFHRVIPGFMIQGGGFDAEMVMRPTHSSIVNEAGNGIRNRRGTLAMARTQDLHSANSQFFINLVDNEFLNGDGETGGYAVFGRVYSGMEVVDQIAQVETTSTGGHSDVPVDPVLILGARRQ